MARAKPQIVEWDMHNLEPILRRIEAGESTPSDMKDLRTLSCAYIELVGLLRDKETNISRLRKMLFGATTEKTEAVLGKKSGSSDKSSTESEEDEPSEKEGKPPPKGHGRNGADAYVGGETIEARHESLAPGDPCPECDEGVVYESMKPGVLVRLIGQAPVQAKIYRLQKLRCGLCGKVFTASPPEGVGNRKHDPTVAGMIALLKYGGGLPFNRLQGLQGSLGIPLPASTQWDLVNNAAPRLAPVLTELIRQAAQGDVVYHDDTGVKILERMGKRGTQRRAALAEAASDGQAFERTGMYTTGIVSTSREGRRITLFFSGPKHAGENLIELLRHRAKALARPIQMCDAASRNMPEELETILANCLAHARRKFVEVADRFPRECLYVLHAFQTIYRNDAKAKEQELSPEERLAFHQKYSRRVMNNLKAWLRRRFAERRVEPNSSLGGAIKYLLRHWNELTAFLRQAGAPLDNNICERALKRAVLHRKNALFFKTDHGAAVGDLYMSLIQTCYLSGANPFEYLTALQRNADALTARPQDWMPWNYRSANA